MKLPKTSRLKMFDREIAERLRLIQSLRAISRDLGAALGRLKKSRKFAKAAGSIDGESPPTAFPEVLFDDAECLSFQPSDQGLALRALKDYVTDRREACGNQVTVFEELYTERPFGRSGERDV